MHKRTAFFFVFLLLPNYLYASATCTKFLATAVSIQGKVDTQVLGSFDWKPISIDHNFCYGDKVRTLNSSRVTLMFKNGPRVVLSQNSTLSFSSTTEKKTPWIINLIKGAGFFRSRETQQLKVQTPFINAVHEGTEFLVEVGQQQTEITVFDGVVKASNPLGSVYIKQGFTGFSNRDKAPEIRKLVLKPEDAVQWSLYYPPIIDVETFDNTAFSSSIKLYQQGNSYQALIMLDTVPKGKQGADYLVLKASLLLTLGDVKNAIIQIDRALLKQVNNSSAIALQAIIAITKNRKTEGLRLAQKAVNADPQSATAKIALSYSYQSQFKLREAQLATQEAVYLAPNNALAWAQLAELQLSNGQRDEALKSAQQAQKLNPTLGRTQTVLGFNYLAQVDIDRAKKVFNQAIKFNPDDPLAHLGLGLAYIREGQLEKGTQHIETAVSLDPDNAMMRSYLGKAYYELRNNDYAATELKIAKQMDPKDPTPWFYDAIRKQSINQPIEALEDMQKAIELNDNRGVYRSKLLLDEDAAAKSANMARIYQDLDFNRVALKQAWDSLGQDFTNPSSHRFLSDNLQGKARHRVARASELLQAQLFQPINVIPVQPQSGENIGILNSTGPGSLSSNEYDALYAANGAHILANGAVGSNNTFTDNLVISGIYDNLSLSFGQFHYQTDGFRANDDYKQNIYNIFAQYSINSDLNLSVEFKTEEVIKGDVALRLNNFHQENFRESIRQDTARLGLNYEINNQQDFILSAFFTDFKEKESNREFALSATVSAPGGSIKNSSIKNSSTKREESGYQIEAQYLFHPESFSLTAGFGFISLNANNTINSQTDKTSQFFFAGGGSLAPSTTNGPQIVDTVNQKTNSYNGYIYSLLDLTKNLTSTLGLSLDIYDDGLVQKNQINPKVGVIWSPSNTITFRSAVFKTLKKPLVASQTIEPTQIAGFNQFFDELNGTTAWNYGLGMDLFLIKNLYLGGEVTWRDTKQAVVLNKNVSTQRRDESAHLAYLYWSPLSWLALSSEYRFFEFNREYSLNNIDSINPTSLRLHQVPLSMNFYHSSGLFTKLSGVFVNQSIEVIEAQNKLAQYADDFWLFDTAIGLRFPKKIGSLSLEVKNIFNTRFNYHSEVDMTGAQISDIVPERQFFLKLNLAY